MGFQIGVLESHKVMGFQNGVLESHKAMGFQNGVLESHGYEQTNGSACFGAKWSDKALLGLTAKTRDARVYFWRGRVTR